MVNNTFQLPPDELENWYNLYDGVSLSDHTGRIIMINPGLSRITGLPPDVFLHQSMISLYKRGYFAYTPFSYKALKERKIMHGIQETCTGKKVMATAKPILDSSGSVCYVLVGAKDVTKLRGLKEELKREKNWKIHTMQRLPN